MVSCPSERTSAIYCESRLGSASVSGFPVERAQRGEEDVPTPRVGTTIHRDLGVPSRNREVGSGRLLAVRRGSERVARDMGQINAVAASRSFVVHSRNRLAEGQRDLSTPAIYTGVQVLERFRWSPK